jgi:hypothetical protein
MTGVASPNRAGGADGETDQHAQREVGWAVAQRYGAAGRREKGRILDELTATTGWLANTRYGRCRLLRRAAQADCSRVWRRDGAATDRQRRKYAGARDALINVLLQIVCEICGVDFGLKTDQIVVTHRRNEMLMIWKCRQNFGWWKRNMVKVPLRFHRSWADTSVSAR